MAHQGYSFSEYPICRNSSCAQIENDSYMSQSESCFWAGEAGGNSRPLPESGSRSDDTIVNRPGVCGTSGGEEQSDISAQCSCMGSCCCCRMPEPIGPGQELASPGPMTFAPFPFMPMGMPMFCPGNGGPAGGMYAMPASANGMYAMPASANGMYALPAAAAAPTAAMGMDQDAVAGRGAAGQAPSNSEVNSSYNNAGASPSGYSGMSGNAAQPSAPMGSYPVMPGAYHPSMAGPGADQNSQGPDAAAAYDYVQKYNQSIQQFLATAEQNAQQSLAQAQAQAQHANPQVFNNLQPGMPPGLATAGAMGAQPYYPGLQEGFGNSSMGPPQYFPNAMSMGMPSLQPTALYGMNSASSSSSSSSSSSAYYGSQGLSAGGAFNDSLQTQTVYSTDYKPFAAQGNNFNHFPNGIDIGLPADSCPAYGSVGPVPGPGAGVPPEMCSQLYGMGMGMGMGMDVGNNSAYPLSQMSYASYPCEMPMPGAPSAGGYLPSFNMSGKSI
ncbi:GL22715 [Drosophila persimilis]|uniref:GL22715 n=2 Tax=Drosophila persimilis TaxID=7234 RepID=B4GZV9_DROPE|nr:GL22715 [Drosophila persimilis]